MKRALRRLAGVALALVALVAAVLLTGWAWVQSAAGQHFIAAQVQQVAAQSIAGRVELEAVQLSTDALQLRNLKLYTPEGGLVAEVAQLDVAFRREGLTSGDVQLRSVELKRPRLHLVNDERGLNLSRALASKEVAAPSASTQATSALKLTLARLALRDGDIDATDGVRTVAVEKLSVDGAAVMNTAPLQVDGKATLTADTTAPLRAPLKLDLVATSPHPDEVAGDVKLSLGDSTLRVRGTWPTLTMTVEETSLTVDTVKAVVPEWPLKVPLQLSAQATQTDGRVQLHLGSAAVVATGAWAPDFSSVSRFALDVTELDPAELLGRGPPSRFSLSASGSAPRTDVAQLEAQASVKAQWKRGTQSLAQLEAKVHADGGEVDVRACSLHGPGVSLLLSGKGSAQSLALTGRLTASSLAALRATLAEFVDELPPLAGAGQLDVVVKGPPSHPSVSLQGQLRGLVVASTSVGALEVDVRVPDVARPLDSDGSLWAKQLVVGGSAVESVKAAVATHGREMAIDLSTTGWGDLVLHAEGTMARNAEALALSQLEFRTPEQRWLLEAPSEVKWSAKAVSVAPLELRAGTQRLRLSLQKQGARVTAGVTAAGVNLAKLPKALNREAWGVRGIVDATIQVDGVLPRPDVEARVAWKEGEALGVEGVSASVDGSWKARRATGTVQFASPLGRLGGTVDADLDALSDGREAAFQAHLEAYDLDVGSAAALAKQPVPVEAKVAARLDVSGTSLAPQLALSLGAPDIVIARGDGGVVVNDGTLLVFSGDGGLLDVTVSAKAYGGAAKVTASTPWTLASLLSHPPDAEALRAAPLNVGLEVKNVSVRGMREAGFLDDVDAEGTADLTGRITGSVNAPRLTMTTTASGVSVGSLTELSGTTTLTASDTTTWLEAKLSHRGALLFSTEAKVQAPLERLQHVDALGPEAISVLATVHPVDVATLQSAPTEESGGGGRLRGQAGARLTVEGTLASPQVVLAGSIANLFVGQTKVGSARLDVRTERTATKVALSVGGLGKDQLSARGTVGLVPSIAVLRDGVDVRQAPVDLTLDSRNFDLAFLSGAHPMLRRLEGRLTMLGSVKGTLGEPAVTGDVRWSEGRMGLMGYGDYRDVELEARATNSMFEVKQLSMRSGGGTASMSMKAERAATASTWVLSAATELKRFPVVTDDQLLCFTTMTMGLDGDISGNVVDLRSLRLPNVTVELPDVKRKNLQDLDRAGDIVLLKPGASARRRRSAPGAAQAKAEEGGFTVRAVVEAPRHLFVKGSDLDVELGLADGFRVEYQNGTQMFGEATVLRGQLSVIGRDFTVQKGSQVRFAGVAKQPYVNVVALYLNERNGEKTKVTVSVSGKGTDVSLKVSSEPPMPEPEIYTMLATGRRSLQVGTGASISSDQAASAIMGAVSSQVKSFLAKKVPIDVLNFEPTENMQGMRIDVGKYLTDSLFLGYQGNPGARPERGENPHSVKLEYQLPYGMSLEANAGTAPAAGADVVWSRDF